MHEDLFRQLNASGIFVEEIVRYIHHMVIRCNDIESYGGVGRVPINRRPTDHGNRQLLGQIVGLIGTAFIQELQTASTDSSIVSVHVVNDPEVVSVTDEVNDRVKNNLAKYKDDDLKLIFGLIPQNKPFVFQSFIYEKINDFYISVNVLQSVDYNSAEFKDTEEYNKFVKWNFSHTSADI